MEPPSQQETPEEFTWKTDWKDGAKLTKFLRPHLTLLNGFAALLFLVIVVSGACFFMVFVGWIQPSGVWPDTKENWYEANSQILNGCFTLMALITQPYRAYLAYWTYKWHTSPSLDEKREWAAKIKKSMPDIILHPCNLNTTVPLSPSSPPPTSRNATPPTRNASDADIEVVVVAAAVDSSTPVFLQKKENKELSNPLDATPPKTWLSILLLLNLNCIFQYPITIAMWGYIGQAYARPPWIIGLFLPLSFLCGFASGIWPALHGDARKKRMMEKGGGQARGSTNTANTAGL